MDGQRAYGEVIIRTCGSRNENQNKNKISFHTNESDTYHNVCMLPVLTAL